MIIRRRPSFYIPFPFIMLFLCLSTSCHQENPVPGGRKLPEMVIAARIFLDLQTLGTDFEISRTFFQTKLFHMTEDLTAYLIDSNRHRILEIDREGRLRRVIGGIGQREIDLYYPVAVTANNKMLAVINNSGGEIKIFDRFAPKIRVISRKETYFLPSLIIGQENELIAPARKVTRSIAEMNEEPIFSIFDFNFNQIRTFGKAIKCSSHIAHLHFNLVELFADGQIIYGAYACLPILFAFDRHTGKELFKRDLRLSDIPEINRALQREREIMADTPEKQNKPNQIRLVRINRGIGVYKGSIYYLGYEKFLLFGPQAEFLGTLKITLNDQDITSYIDCFVILPAGRMFGLATRPENRQPIIFEADL